jgi:Zn-dependent protease
MGLLDTLNSNPTYFFIILLSLVLSIGLHEFAHVFAAYLQGDETGARMGRLTLNPLKHIDLIGLAAILLAGIGWGKPAPFNPNNLRFRRWGTFLVAIAGPLTNILLVAIFGYAATIFVGRFPDGNLMILFFSTMAIMNASLAVFNLLPIPPLDGSRFLSAILGHQHPLVQFLGQYGFYLVFGLIIIGPLIGLNLIGAWIQGGTSILSCFLVPWPS